MTFVRLANNPNVPEVELSAAIFADPYIDEVLADSPNGAWSLTDLTDSAGLAGTLTEFAGPIPSATGLLDTDAGVARDLNGSTMYWTAADGTFTDLGDVFTFEIWAVFDAVANQQLFSKDAGAPGVFLDSGGVFTLSKAGTATIAQGGTLSPATRYHLVATKNGATFKMYINGVDVTTPSANQTCTNTATALNIGRNTAATNFVNGRLQWAAIYPTALSAARVLAHYEAGVLAWTDLTPYLRGYDWERGRTRETERSSTGSLRATLSNRDRRFDRTYTSGPYYGHFDKAWRIRLRSRWSSVVYPRWAGTKEKLTLSWPGTGTDAVCEMRASGRFKILNRADIAANSYAQALAGARIVEVLGNIGVPAADYDVDPGQAVVAPREGSEEPQRVAPLEHLQQVAEADDGFLFENAAGQIAYQDGLYRVEQSHTSSATLGDLGGAEIPYADGVTASEDETLLRNTVSITPAGGVAETVEDLESIRRESPAAFVKEMLMLDQGYAQAYAQHQIARYANRTQRISTVTLLGMDDPSKWPTILVLEMSDRVTFKMRPLGVGTISEDQFIEALGESCDPHGNYRVSLAQSPADDAAIVYFVVDTHALDGAAVLY